MSENDEESPPSVASGIVIAGRYRVDRRLGAGGMGEVYLVQHVHTDERLAMKVLLSTVISDQTALERFRREARTPARIDSDHVVRVTDADVAPELNGAPFLVMEYLRGEDLDQFLTQHGPMSPADVVAFLQQIARALDKAHVLGIVHRDLKPENIFITRREDGSPLLKILDFGIAKFTGSSAVADMVNKTATSPGQIYGTPLFMSPEQAKGESKLISGQTDIWALGLIASRMLSGQDYWDAETLTALIAQVVYEPMRKPSEKGFDFGPDYDAWFLKCCDRDVQRRFPTAGEAVFKLGQALGVIDLAAAYGATTTAPIAAPPPSLASRAGQRPLSKTDIQLAQTAATISAPPTPRGSPLLKVALGAVAVGAVVGVIGFGLVGEKPTPVAASGEREVTTVVVTVTASQPAPAVEPLETTSAATSVTADATATAVESTSAKVSAMPTTTAATTAPKLPTGKLPTAKPTVTAAPTATATVPPVKDPLSGRH